MVGRDFLVGRILRILKFNIQQPTLKSNVQGKNFDQTLPFHLDIGYSLPVRIALRSNAGRLAVGYFCFMSLTLFLDRVYLERRLPSSLILRWTGRASQKWTASLFYIVSARWALLTTTHCSLLSIFLRLLSWKQQHVGNMLCLRHLFLLGSHIYQH